MGPSGKRKVKGWEWERVERRGAGGLVYVAMGGCLRRTELCFQDLRSVSVDGGWKQGRVVCTCPELPMPWRQRILRCAIVQLVVKRWMER